MNYNSHQFNEFPLLLLESFQLPSSIDNYHLLFLTGNSQGKMQKDGTLGKNRARDDFLLQTFQGGNVIMINVPMPTNRGILIITKLVIRLSEYIRRFPKIVRKILRITRIRPKISEDQPNTCGDLRRLADIF